MTLRLVRHPRTAAAPGLCYGRLDLALGPEAAAEIAAAVTALGVASAVWSSPAARCRALAEPVARRHGVSLVLDDRLRELDFGAWEGRRWDAIPRAESDPWAADPMAVAPPGGETFAALLARVSAALAEAPAGAVIVSHAGPIRAARMLAGASFETAFAEPVPFAAPLAFAAAPEPA